MIPSCISVHRKCVAITYEAEAEDKHSARVVRKILDELPVP